MTNEERVASYGALSGFPQSLFVAADGRIVGTFFLGNDYRVASGYHGGYPPNYLRRVRALFPDKRSALHLFSGRVDTRAFPGATVDRRPELAPDHVCDAHDLSGVPLGDFDIILADPPYTAEDADHYGATMVKRNTVMKALAAGVRSGTHIVWLDQVFPMFSKAELAIDGAIGTVFRHAEPQEALADEGSIGVVRSTNHRVRQVFIFRRR